MAEKETGPGTPWKRPGPFKNLGKTKESAWGAAGNGLACWGPPGKSYGRWKTLKTIGKTTFSGRSTNVAEKKTGPVTPSGPHGNGRGPMKYLGKTKVSCKGAAEPLFRPSVRGGSGKALNLSLLVCPRIAPGMLYGDFHSKSLVNPQSFSPNWRFPQ